MFTQKFLHGLTNPICVCSPQKVALFAFHLGQGLGGGLFNLSPPNAKIAHLLTRSYLEERRGVTHFSGNCINVVVDEAILFGEDTRMER